MADRKLFNAYFDATLIQELGKSLKYFYPAFDESRFA